MLKSRITRIVTILAVGILAVTTTWALDALHQERVDHYYDRSQADYDHSRQIHQIIQHDERSMALLKAVAQDLDHDGTVTAVEFHEIMDTYLGEVQ